MAPISCVFGRLPAIIRKISALARKSSKPASTAIASCATPLRWMLGSLAHSTGEEVALADMPEMERLMLHRLAELDVMGARGLLGI